MKKTKFALVFTSLGMLLLSGCSAPKCSHEFELCVDDTFMQFKSGQVRNTDFNAEGIQVYKRCTKCNEIEDVGMYSVSFEGTVSEENNTALIEAGDLQATYEFEIRDQIKVACIGDSLTAGHDWANQSYPTYLKEYLGNAFDVKNLGINGVSITGYGGSWNNPAQRWSKKPEYNTSLSYAPDVFVIMLGTNDATGWANAQETFETEYRSLLDTYISRFPDSKFAFLISPPVISPNGFGIPDDKIRDEVNPIQRQLAEDYCLDTIDLRELFEADEEGVESLVRSNMKSNGSGSYNDNVHFSVKGAQYVASLVKDLINTYVF